ncbi:protein bicaudal C homolog 1-B-like, partial [Tachysurus ichikawai]
VMEETNTQIAWPSKLKIGAKSKKGKDYDCICAYRNPAGRKNQTEYY